jgi:hypothetical protein
LVWLHLFYQRHFFRCCNFLDESSLLHPLNLYINFLDLEISTTWREEIRVMQEYFHLSQVSSNCECFSIIRLRR